MHEDIGKSKGFRIVILIAAAFLLFGLLSGLRAVTSVLIPSISEWTGMSYGEVSIGFSVMNIILAVSGPLFGLLTLKIHPAKVMIAGAVLGGVGLIGTAFSTNLPSLIFFCGVVFGLGASALCYPIVYAAAVPVIGEKYSILFGGILSASQGMISMVLPQLLNAGSDIFGLQACLILIGVISLCMVPLCFLFLRKKEKSLPVVKQEKPAHQSLKSAVTLSFFLMMAFAMFTHGVCDGGMMNHLTEYTMQYGASESSSAYMLSVYNFCTMVGCFLGGIVCSRVKNVKGVIVFIFLFCAVQTIIGYLTPAGYLKGFIIFGLYGIAMGMCVPAYSAVAYQRISIAKFAAIYSILTSFYYIACSLDSLFGGIFYDIFGDFIIVEMIALGLSIATAAVFFISMRKDKKRQEDNVCE